MVASRTALDTFVLLLRKMPELVMGKQQGADTAFKVAGLKVSNLEVSVDTTSLYDVDASDISGGESTAGNSGGSSSSIEIYDVDVDETSSSTAITSMPRFFTTISESSTVTKSSPGSNSITNSINMTALATKNQDPPTIKLQATRTVQRWPASFSTSSSDLPSAIAFDSMDSFNVAIIITYMQCTLQPDWLDVIESGKEAGELPALVPSCVNVSSIDFSRPNRPGEAFLVEYGATNSRNITAIPKRLLLVVTDPCQSSGESWCYDLSKCSVAGLCVDLNLGSTSSGSSTGISIADVTNTAVIANMTSRPMVPLFKDTTPPLITLRGGGRFALNKQGQALMVEDVYYKSRWADPGATATDINEYGITVDVSSRVQSYGAAAVDTSVVTPPASLYGFAVQYTVTDASGNAATPALRLIRVVCTSPEVYCTYMDSQGSTAGTCTVNGVCLQDMSGEVNGWDSSSSSMGGGISTGAFSSYSSSSLQNISGSHQPGALGSHASANMPRILLLGPQHVHVQQYEAFDRCPSGASFRAVCDAGARAFDPVEGNLDRQVTVCGQTLYPATGQLPVPVLLACGVSTSTPGSFNLSYSVRNSAGVSASTWRTITVVAACSLGERICSDMVTCSTDGLCESELVDPSARAATSSSAISSSSRVPPVISLIISAVLPSRVRIKQGRGYAYCNGSEPTPDSLCELGAVILRPDGSPGIEGVNLTANIVACPPAVCLGEGGCTEEVLNSYRLTQRGLAGCGIDSMAPVGTVFPVDLWVWDSDGTNATVVRHVEIADPCPPVSKFDTTSYKLCHDINGRSYCSPLPCDKASFMRPPVQQPPVLVLLADVAYVEYGTFPLYDLAPCAALPNVSDPSGVRQACGAYALAKSYYSDGKIDIVDLSSAIEVVPIISCSTGAVETASAAAINTSSTDGTGLGTSGGNTATVKTNYSQACTACPLEMLHMLNITGTGLTGGCLPGTYSYRFSVSYRNTTVTHVLTVHVYVSRSVKGVISPFQLYDNTSMATTDAAAINATIDLLANFPPDYKDDILATDDSAFLYRKAVTDISYNLSSLAIDASDVIIISVLVVPIQQQREGIDGTADTMAALQLMVEVYGHYPAAVHLSAIRAFNRYIGDLMADANYLIELLSEKLSHDLRTATTGNAGASRRSQLSVRSVRNSTDEKLHQATTKAEPHKGHWVTGQGGMHAKCSPMIAAHMDEFSGKAVLCRNNGVAAQSSSSSSGDRTTGGRLLASEICYLVIDLASKLFQSDGVSDAQSMPFSSISSSSTASTFVQTSSARRKLLNTQLVGGVNVTNMMMASAIDAFPSDTNDTRVALADSLRTFMAAMQSQVLALQRSAGQLRSMANISLSESASENAQHESNGKQGMAVSALLGAQHVAVDDTITRSNVIIANLGHHLSLLSDQQVMLSETTGQLSDMVARTEMELRRAVYDTMVLEEYTGQYTYAWSNCGSKLNYTRPRAETAWSFYVARQGDVSKNVAEYRRSALAHLGLSTRGTAEPKSGLGYVPVASEHELADQFLYGPGVNASVMMDRRLLRSLHLVGGILLHGVRREMDEQGRCAGDRGAFKGLNFDCVRHDISNILGNISATSTIASILRDLFAVETNSLHPYGTDPVFLPSSSLYDARLSDVVSHYYNTSDESGEVSGTGAPYTYYYKRLHGYPDGFPVLLPNQLTEARLRDMISYLQDSNFLDRYTRRLTAEVLVLSSHLRVFGHVMMTFAWGYDGSIQMTTSFSGLPALTYIQPTDADNTPSSLQFLSTVARNELAGLWALTVLFVVFAALHTTGKMLEIKRADATTRQACRLLGNVLPDITVAALLLIGSVTCTWYMLTHAAVFSARQHYIVYDSILTARARWLLRHKTEPWMLAANSSQAAELQEYLALLNITDLPNAGDPGRYLLPDAPHDQLDELAEVLANVHGMARAWTTYCVVQAFTLVLLIARLLSTLSFQGRLGALVRSLYHAVPPLTHLLFVLLLMCVLLAAMTHFVLGTYMEQVSTFAGALNSTVMLFLGRGVLASFQGVLPKNTELTTAQCLAATLVVVSQVVILNFMLINFFFTVVVTTFHKVKASRTFWNSLTMWQDLNWVVLPDMAFAVRNCVNAAAFGRLRPKGAPPPSNRQINRTLMTKLLAREDDQPLDQRFIPAIRLRVDCAPSKATAVPGQHWQNDSRSGADAVVGNLTESYRSHCRRLTADNYRYLDLSAVQTLLRCSDMLRKRRLESLQNEQQQQQLTDGRHGKIKPPENEWANSPRSDSIESWASSRTPNMQIPSPHIPSSGSRFIFAKLAGIAVHAGRRLWHAGWRGGEKMHSWKSQPRTIITEVGDPESRPPSAHTLASLPRGCQPPSYDTLDHLYTVAAERLMACQAHTVEILPVSQPRCGPSKCTNSDQASSMRAQADLVEAGVSGLNTVHAAPKGLNSCRQPAGQLGISDLRTPTTTTDGNPHKTSTTVSGNGSHLRRTAATVFEAEAVWARTETVRTKALYDALRDVVNAMLKWQTGVHKWQVKVWKQQNAMRSEYMTMLSVFTGAQDSAPICLPSKPRLQRLPELQRPAGYDMINVATATDMHAVSCSSASAFSNATDTAATATGGKVVCHVAPTFVRCSQRSPRMISPQDPSSAISSVMLQHSTASTTFGLGQSTSHFDKVKPYAGPMPILENNICSDGAVDSAELNMTKDVGLTRGSSSSVGSDGSVVSGSLLQQLSEALSSALALPQAILSQLVPMGLQLPMSESKRDGPAGTEQAQPGSSHTPEAVSFVTAEALAKVTAEAAIDRVGFDISAGDGDAHYTACTAARPHEDNTGSKNVTRNAVTDQETPADNTKIAQSGTEYLKPRQGDVAGTLAAVGVSSEPSSAAPASAGCENGGVHGTRGTEVSSSSGVGCGIEDDAVLCSTFTNEPSQLSGDGRTGCMAAIVCKVGEEIFGSSQAIQYSADGLSGHQQKATKTTIIEAGSAGGEETFGSGKVAGDDDRDDSSSDHRSRQSSSWIRLPAASRDIGTSGDPSSDHDGFMQSPGATLPLLQQVKVPPQQRQLIRQPRSTMGPALANRKMRPAGSNDSSVSNRQSSDRAQPTDICETPLQTQIDPSPMAASYVPVLPSAIAFMGLDLPSPRTGHGVDTQLTNVIDSPRSQRQAWMAALEKQPNTPAPEKPATSLEYQQSGHGAKSDSARKQQQQQQEQQQRQQQPVRKALVSRPSQSSPPGAASGPNKSSSPMPKLAVWVKSTPSVEQRHQRAARSPGKHTNNVEPAYAKGERTATLRSEASRTDLKRKPVRSLSLTDQQLSSNCSRGEDINVHAVGLPPASLETVSRQLQLQADSGNTQDSAIGATLGSPRVLRAAGKSMSSNSLSIGPGSLLTSLRDGADSAHVELPRDPKPHASRPQWIVLSPGVTTVQLPISALMPPPARNA